MLWQSWRQESKKREADGSIRSVPFEIEDSPNGLAGVYDTFSTVDY